MSSSLVNAVHAEANNDRNEDDDDTVGSDDEWDSFDC